MKNRKGFTLIEIIGVIIIIGVIALIIFGSREILNFNIALLVGMVAGVLSSLFLAAQIWYELTKNNTKKEPKKHWLDDEKEELKIKGINS